jgi:hypothetical protein
MNLVLFSIFMQSISAVLITSDRKCASAPVPLDAVSLFLDELAIPFQGGSDRFFADDQLVSSVNGCKK